MWGRLQKWLLSDRTDLIRKPLLLPLPPNTKCQDLDLSVTVTAYGTEATFASRKCPSLLSTPKARQIRRLTWMCLIGEV